MNEITLTLRPRPDPTDPEGVRRIQAALKVLGRRFGLRCVAIRYAADDVSINQRHPTNERDGKPTPPQGV